MGWTADVGYYTIACISKLGRSGAITGQIMTRIGVNSRIRSHPAIAALGFFFLLCVAPLATVQHAFAEPPVPLLSPGQKVNWWFVFKLNAKVFPACGAATVVRACPFGGTPKLKTATGTPYRFGQQFAFASNNNATLRQGSDCLGDTTSDPVGATFDQIYNGSYNFVVWNDQFNGHPDITSCGSSCDAGWGHSKGMLAWDENGEGMVLQVSTPSWPGAGSKSFPRQGDGNSLGCVVDDDVEFSQHFFALKLDKTGVMNVLHALQNASVVTDPSKQELTKVDGPPDIKSLVGSLHLGTKSHAVAVTKVRLSPDVELISKPSALHVPPWQMISSVLDGVPLRAATWFAHPEIPTTTESTKPECWDSSLVTPPGPVEIATSGEWDNKKIGLKGGPAEDANHAKIGVPTGGDKKFAVFGDMNQQGTLVQENGKCDSSQNGRGGLFFVVHNDGLFASVSALLKGETAPAAP
jgi:hypothetical protein